MDESHSRPLHAPAALLLYRQIVAGQEGGEPLPFGRGIDVRPERKAGRERRAPVSQQRSQAPPVRPGRIGALARLLDHIQRHEAVWLCTRTAIARWEVKARTLRTVLDKRN